LVTRKQLSIADVKRLQSGRGIAAEYRGIWLVNIPAPSGAAKRQEKERFHTTECTYLLETASYKMIVGGDFNCVLNKMGSIGHLKYSKAFDG